MKSYEEMSKDVLHRIDEYQTERKMKRAKVTKVAASVMPVCAAAVVGVGLWRGGVLAPNHNQLISGTVTSSTVSEIPQVVIEDIPGDIQYDPPVQQTEPVTQYVPDESSGASNGGEVNSGGNNGWVIFISTLELNGVTYYDNDMANVSAYTQDRFIGKVSDFRGEYKDSVNYRINPNDSVYTVKETTDVLFIVKDNGTIVIMSSPAWSLDKYESERLEPDYVDPAYSPDDTIPVYNGFCQ